MRSPVEPEFAAFPAYSGPAEPGFYYDFLGVRTRIAYVEPHLPKWISGHVFGYPDPENPFTHTHPEWIGFLRAVLEAKEQFVAVELGAGWGPWIVAAYKAASLRNIANINVVGVEGLAAHVEMMRQHCDDNGLPPDKRTIIHGVVGLQDGTAYFPIVPDPVYDWGSQAIFADAQPPNTTAVRSISLPTIISWFERVDLIHCDVQGAEHAIFPAAMEGLNRKVRRVVIGTHSPEIDSKLERAFSEASWQPETIAPWKTDGTDWPVDGTQVWRNPRV